MSERVIDEAELGRLARMTIADIELWLGKVSNAALDGAQDTVVSAEGYRTPVVPGAVFFELEDLLADPQPSQNYTLTA